MKITPSYQLCCRCKQYAFAAKVKGKIWYCLQKQCSRYRIAFVGAEHK